MRRHWLRGTLGLVSILTLLAAACAPAAEQKAPAAEAPKPAAEAPKPAAEAPKPAVEAPKPAATEPTASVNGIPLDPKAKRGGILRSAYNTEGPSFNMWEEKSGIAFNTTTPSSNGLLRSRTWGTLEDYNRQAFLELWPDLAKSWEQSSDGLRWTFRLREGVTFSDGTRFTCADAKWGLDAVRTGKGLKRSPLAPHFLAVNEIQCTDDLTMVVILKRPKPSFLDAVGAPNISVMPRHKYENNTDELRTKPPIGTGPFIVTQWIPAEKIVLTRNPNYWNKPFPYLDGIEYTFIASAAQPPALRTGRVDIASYTGYNGAQAQSLIKECTQCQVWPKVFSQGPNPALMVNHQRPPWNNPLIKDAISLSIDRVKLAQLGRQGWYSPPLGGVFYPGSYWAMPKELLATIPGYNFETPEENKKRARELIAQAGYRSGELTIPFGVSWYCTAEGPVIIEELQSVGFKVVPKNYEVAEGFEILGSGAFDVAIHCFWDGGVDPDFPLYEQFYTGVDRNYNRYSNREFDRLVDEMSVTLDREQRRQKAWKAGEIALRDNAKTYLGFSAQTPILGPRIRNLMPGPGFMYYGAPVRYEHVWLAD